MNPQDFQAGNQHRNITRRRIFAGAGVFAAVMIAMALLLPFMVREMAASRIDRAAAALSGTVSHDDIRIVSTRKLLIPSLTFTGPDGIEVHASDVMIEVDPLAMIFGGRRISAVDVEDLSIKAGTPESPLDVAPLASRIISRLSGRRTAAAAGTPGTAVQAAPARHAGTPMPDVRVNRITGSFSTSFISGTIDGGSGFLAGDPDSIDAHARKASIELNVTPDGENVRHTININADMTDRGRFSSVAVSGAPGIARRIRGLDVGAGGFEWRPGEVRITHPFISLPDTARFPSGVTADDILLKWSFLKDGAAPASTLIPESMARYVPESVKLLAGMVSISEVRVNHPVLDIAMMARSPTLATDQTPAQTATDSPSVRDRISAIFSGISASVESGRAAMVRLGEGYAGTKFGVTGATVKYVSQAGTATRSADSFSNLDIQVEGIDEGMSIRMRFECPESASVRNEFDVLVRKDGNVDMHMKASQIKLAPYQVILPRWLETDSRSALTDTDLAIHVARGPRLEATGRIGLTDVTVSIPEVASESMTSVDVALSGKTVLDGEAGTLTMSESVFSIGEIKVPFSFDGSSMHASPRLSINGRIDRIAGESLLTSLPRESIPVLGGARLSGTFAATIKLEIDTSDMSRLVFDFVPDMADLITIDLGPAVNLELLRSTFLHRIEDRDHVVTRTIGVGSPGWVPFETVPGYMIKALTASEDSRFFEHQGFSKAGIERSLKVNLERGGFFQGASTLSQQLVKNLFLSREKTLSRKLQEAFITWQVERNLPKEKILELYLNVIEWGPEVWGLKEAANHYFAKDPSDLTVLEAAFLVLIIPNPGKYHKFLEERRVPAWFMTKVRTLVETLRSIGAVSDLEALSALQQTIRFPVDNSPAATVPDSEFND